MPNNSAAAVNEPASATLTKTAMRSRLIAAGRIIDCPKKLHDQLCRKLFF
jgi:hypothetical protein